MSNLPKRLRLLADHCVSLTQDETDPLIRELAAADIETLRFSATEIERLRTALREIRAKNDQMAEDDALWFAAETAAEAYLQFELRELCAVIESVSPGEAKDE